MTQNQKLFTKCSTIKELHQFNKNKNKSEGLQVTCRECNAIYRETNKGHSHA